MAEAKIEPESPSGSFFFYYHIDFTRTLQILSDPFLLAEVSESAPGSSVWDGILVVSLVQTLLCEILQILLFLERILKIAF